LKNDGDFIRRIENGYLFMESKIDKAKLIYMGFYIDESRDYEIETNIKFVKGKPNTGHALLWGKDPDRDYGFYFTGQQSYKISKYDGGYVDFTPFQTNTIIKPNDYNKLTIRKIGAKMYFFINEELVHNMDSQPLFGQSIGLQVGGSSVIYVDDLVLSYLNEVKTNKQKTLAPIEPLRPNSNVNMTYNWINTQNVTTFFDDNFSNNTNEWGVGTTEDVFRSVEKGYYLFQCYIESYYSTTKSIIIDETRNFQIETAVKIAEGRDNIENGLIWGMLENSSYRFCFSKQGEFTIYKMDDGSVVDIVDYTPADNYYANDYNKLTVRKFNKNYYFFFNEILVHTAPFESLYGQKIGYLVAKKSTIQVDYLKIIYF